MIKEITAQELNTERFIDEKVDEISHLVPKLRFRNPNKKISGGQNGFNPTK